MGHRHHAAGTGRRARGSFTPALGLDVLTPLYDVAVEALGFGRSFKAEVSRLADVQPDESVLDLGCGTGTLLGALLVAQLHGRYAGIDPDPRVLALAKRRLQGHGVELVEGYAENLPFPAGSFDVVISTLTFHHLADPSKRAALQEVGRVLTGSGRFLLVDFGRPGSWVARTLLGAGSLVDGRANMRANLAGDLPGLLGETGFEVREVRPPRRGVSFLLATRS